MNLYLSFLLKDHATVFDTWVELAYYPNIWQFLNRTSAISGMNVESVHNHRVRSTTVPNENIRTSDFELK